MPVRWETGEVCEVGACPKLKDQAGKIVYFSYRLVRWYGRAHFKIRVGDEARFVRRGKKCPDRASSVCILAPGPDSPGGSPEVTHEKSRNMNDFNSSSSEFCLPDSPGPHREPPTTPRQSENCPVLTGLEPQLTDTSSQPPSLEAPEGESNLTFIISRLEDSLKRSAVWHPLGIDLGLTYPPADSP
eukprot:Hpha_TRINITY_DN12919_c0_g3::TRINITY_DN12919_c0_g3_i1::g.164632::m.164632